MSSGCRCLVASLSSSISRNLNIYSLINSLMARYRGPRGLVALTQVVTSFTPHEDTGTCVAASAAKRSIAFTITEKAPTRAFSWLKADTSI